MGRPELPLDPGKVETLAAQGLSEEQIARSLGVHYNTLLKRKKKYVEFEEAIKNGRAKGVATVTNALFKKAQSGDTTAMIFFLKNRDPDGWLEPERKQAEAMQPVINVMIDK